MVNEIEQWMNKLDQVGEQPDAVKKVVEELNAAYPAGGNMWVPYIMAERIAESAPERFHHASAFLLDPQVIGIGARMEIANCIHRYPTEQALPLGINALQIERDELVRVHLYGSLSQLIRRVEDHLQAAQAREQTLDIMSQVERSGSYAANMGRIAFKALRYL